MSYAFDSEMGKVIHELTDLGQSLNEILVPTQCNNLPSLLLNI